MFPIRHDYLFDSQLCHLNGASYGVSVRPLHEARNKLLLECEARADWFYRHDILAQWQRSTAALATLVHADADDLVFVANATTGTFTALEASLRVAKARGATGCVIVHYSSVYGACRNQIASLVDRDASVRSVCIELHDGVGIGQTHADFVRLTEQCFNALDRTKQAVLFVDHITSSSGVVMPLAQLSALVCKLISISTCQ